MSSPARATLDAADGRGSAEARDVRGHGAGHGTGNPVDRVVALFSGSASAVVAEGEDWSSSLVAVRGVAARVRELQKGARDTVRDAQRAVREADAAARAADDRARHAEAMLHEAVARAERAEEQARLAAERADRAEAQAAEARAWLRRMHECMVSEFGALARETTES
jgi:multidrug resistance efflux pump